MAITSASFDLKDVAKIIGEHLELAVKQEIKNRIYGFVGPMVDDIAQQAAKDLCENAAVHALPGHSKYQPKIEVQVNFGRRKTTEAPVAWVVRDEANNPVFCAGWESACHEHINDAVQNDVPNAGEWTVRPVYA